jgi:acyl carrier protein
LPEYMLPARIVFLDALPVSANGKIDRKALPVPGRSRPELDTQFVAARTIIEKDLAQIWGEVLDLDEIGIHDKFLDLGGDSLSASQIISRVVNRFQLDLPIKLLFDSPTVAEMAAVIASNKASRFDAHAMERIVSELEAVSETEAGQIVNSDGSSTKWKSNE